MYFYKAEKMNKILMDEYALIEAERRLCLKPDFLSNLCGEIVHDYELYYKPRFKGGEHYICLFGRHKLVLESLGWLLTKELANREHEDTSICVLEQEEFKQIEFNAHNVYSIAVDSFIDPLAHIALIREQ